MIAIAALTFILGVFVGCAIGGYCVAAWVNYKPADRDG